MNQGTEQPEAEDFSDRDISEIGEKFDRSKERLDKVQSMSIPSRIAANGSKLTELWGRYRALANKLKDNIPADQDPKNEWVKAGYKVVEAKKKLLGRYDYLLEDLKVENDDEKEMAILDKQEAALRELEGVFAKYEVMAGIRKGPDKERPPVEPKPKEEPEEPPEPPKEKEQEVDIYDIPLINHGGEDISRDPEKHKQVKSLIEAVKSIGDNYKVERGATHTDSTDFRMVKDGWFVSQKNGERVCEININTDCLYDDSNDASLVIFGEDKREPGGYKYFLAESKYDAGNEKKDVQRIVGLLKNQNKLLELQKGYLDRTKEMLEKIAGVKVSN